MRATTRQPFPEGVRFADDAVITVAPGATVKDETGRVIGRVISAKAKYGYIESVIEIDEGVL
jgi:hypothetical protein